LGALVLICAGVAFWVQPKRTLLVFGLFLLAQDLLVTVSSDTSVAISLKHADEIGIALMFLLTLARGWRGRLTKVLLLVVGLIAAGMLSSLAYGINSTSALILDMFLMTKGFLLSLIAAQLDWNVADVRAISRWFGLAGILILLSGLADHLVPAWRVATGLGAPSEHRLGLLAAAGVFTTPGAFGELFSFLFLFAAGLFTTLRSRRSLVLLLLFGIGVVASLRLRLLVTVPVAMALASLIFLRRRGRWFPFFLSAVIGLALLTTPLFEGLLGVKAPELQGGARVALTRTSIDIAGDHFPLGSGFGTFGGYASRLYYSTVYADYGLSDVYGLSETTGSFISDTHWPYVLGETGLVGFLFYSGSLFVLFLTVYRGASTFTDPWMCGFAYGTMMGLILAVLEGFLAPIFQATLNSYFTLFAAGVVAGAYAAHPGLSGRNIRGATFAGREATRAGIRRAR